MKTFLALTTGFLSGLIGGAAIVIWALEDEIGEGQKVIAKRKLKEELDEEYDN